MFKLEDSWRAYGSSMKEYEELTAEMTAATKFVRIPAEDLTFYYRIGNPAEYKVEVISPDRQDRYKDALESFKSVKGAPAPAPAIGILSRERMSESLLNESFDSVGFVCSNEQRGYCVSAAAKATLCMRADLGGEFTTKKSRYLTQTICESLGEKGLQQITLVVKELPSEKTEGAVDRKIFAFMSGKYEPVPMTVLPEAASAIMKEGTLGAAEVKEWYVDHFFNTVRIEFPDAADEFAYAYGIQDAVVPGVLLMSSDTGSSSLIIRGTYRLPDKNGYVITDEYSHKHMGEITAESILKAADDEIMANLRKLPEALSDKIGKVIGAGKVSTDRERAANAAAIKAALKDGMKSLGIKKELGLKKSKVIYEALCAEIDPSVVYTEYDIAMIFCGLPDRVEGISREMQTRLSKACGRAPFADLGGGRTVRSEEEEDFFLMPEGA